MNVLPFNDMVSVDPMYANCRRLYHGYKGDFVWYCHKSHCIHVSGFHQTSEFPKAYRDFIRQYGAPYPLHCDNVTEQKSEEVMDINREYLIRDEFTEPYHPQQNKVETNAIRYLQHQVPLLLDKTGAPESLWHFATVYVADIHNICSDPSLPDSITPLQYATGVTPDISAYL